MTTTEAIQSMIDLTAKNMEILKTINDAFFTQKSHVVYSDKGTSYVIPSFIHLENKINHLQDAFNTLVHSPATGEAWFNFDGNSRAIEIRNYQAAPNPVHLNTTTRELGTKKPTIFKDFMTPIPYLKFDLRELPDDISKVVVKKVIFYNADLFTLIKI